MSRNKPNWRQVVSLAVLSGERLGPTDRAVLVAAYVKMTGTDLKNARRQVDRLWAANVNADGTMKPNSMPKPRREPRTMPKTAPPEPEPPQDVTEIPWDFSP